MFGFTIASPAAQETPADQVPDSLKVSTAWDVPIYKHSDHYINRIARSLGLKIKKQQKVLAESGGKDAGDILFKVIVIK